MIDAQDKPTSERAQKRLFIKTYGCQMNVYDSERMADVLRPLGYAPTDTPEDRDGLVYKRHAARVDPATIDS